MEYIERDKIKPFTLINDTFENRKYYNMPKAQFVLSDLPYNLGNNAYASNPVWYIDGDNSKGESKLAGKQFFRSDKNFNLYNMFEFCSKMLIKEPKEPNKAPCMFLFCAFQQMFTLIEEAKKHGFNHYIPMQFYKNFSAQVLKANMKVVGNTEYGLLFYRDKLPKFRNKGNMVFNCIPWVKDNTTPKVHPTQKPIGILKYLIELFTDEGDVVIDPCAGSGTTLLAAEQLGRKSYGFEIDKTFVKGFEKLKSCVEPELFK